MNDDQITALAHELAEKLYNDDNSYNAILWWHEEPKERKAEELEYTLRFLLRRFCLVEKSKICEAYKDAQADQRNPEGDFALSLAGRNRSAVLIDLFPEIAKEVEG